MQLNILFRWNMTMKAFLNFFYGILSPFYNKFKWRIYVTELAFLYQYFILQIAIIVLFKFNSTYAVPVLCVGFVGQNREHYTTGGNYRDSKMWFFHVTGSGFIFMLFLCTSNYIFMRVYADKYFSKTRLLSLVVFASKCTARSIWFHLHASYKRMFNGHAVMANYTRVL